AKRHLDQLTLLAQTRVKVRRDDQVQEIADGDAVQGDVILLSTGEPVVADGTVLESHYLEVDEALLTGESDPVPPKPGDGLLSGSYAVAGDGVYRADRVGAESFAQSTSAQARAYSYSTSPVQRSINRIIQVLTAAAILLCVMYLALYHARSGYEEADLVKWVAATITSMVPQGLVLMATLAFTLGAVRMARKGAIVQR